jgi:MscS family membrane protein
MQDIVDFFGNEYLGNTIQQYLLFLLIIFSGLFFKHFVSRISNRLIYFLIRRKAEGVSLIRFQELLHKPFSFTLMLVVIYIAFNQLRFPEEWQMNPVNEFGINMVLYRLFFILLYSGFIWLVLRTVDFAGLIFIERINKKEDKPSMQVISFFIDSIKVIVVIFGVLIFLSSIFYINVGTLITGLGIGGLAVALAARESLENLFGSFTIFIDKPFVVGDMVKVGETIGVVENVGFRSTRLRTLDKSYVTLPNKKMIDSELENLTLRTSRRANFSISLTYHTSIEQMRAIVEEIQTFIDNHPNTTVDGRVRFKEFGESSLDIMVMYYVDTMDWTTYLNVREEINYRIMEIVEAHKASFAFPSTSVYIEKHS